jgi:hypothetical protein
LEENRAKGSDNGEEPNSLEHGQSDEKGDDLQSSKVPKLGYANRKLKA